ncbi:MAG: universal stress protein [Pseudomonadota bacterium]|jgi:nucleotide-binding universal stress UspA family protein
MKKNILLVVTDDAARTRATVNNVLAAAPADDLMLHLISVQPRVTSHVAMFFDQAELRAIHEQAGREALAPIEQLLDTAGVSYASHVKVGRKAETIAQAARELHCERIVCGSEGSGATARMFGSLAGQVRQLMAGTRDCEVISS